MKKKTYVTLNDGNDFREVARVMTKNGWKQNHATARNYLNTAISNLIFGIGKELGAPGLDHKTLGSILKNQEVYSILPDILFAAYEAPQGDGKNDTNNK